MKETEGLINQGMTSTADQEYQNLSRGVNESRGLLNQPDGFNQGLSYGNEAMSNAIRSKFSTPYKMQANRMDNQMKLDAKNAHFEKIRVAHQLAGEEANLNFQKEIIKYKQKKAKQAQRQALANGVLGIGGTFLGTAAGGSGGGAAGGQAGGLAGFAPANKG